MGIHTLGARYNTHTSDCEKVDCSILTSPPPGCIATVYTAIHVICKAAKERRCDEISINDVKNSPRADMVSPPKERTLEKKEILAVSDRSTSQVREAKYVGRETPARQSDRWIG